MAKWDDNNRFDRTRFVDFNSIQFSPPWGVDEQDWWNGPGNHEDLQTIRWKGDIMKYDVVGKAGKDNAIFDRLPDDIDVLQAAAERVVSMSPLSAETNEFLRNRRDHQTTMSATR